MGRHGRFLPAASATANNHSCGASCSACAEGQHQHQSALRGQSWGLGLGRGRVGGGREAGRLLLPDRHWTVLPFPDHPPRVCSLSFMNSLNQNSRRAGSSHCTVRWPRVSVWRVARQLEGVMWWSAGEVLKPEASWGGWRRVTRGSLQAEGAAVEWGLALVGKACSPGGSDRIHLRRDG